MNKTEFAIKNYLNKHNIQKNNSDFQNIIINSFFVEHNNKHRRFEVNDTDWNDKLKYVNEHFGLFCQYAQNNWKNL